MLPLVCNDSSAIFFMFDLSRKSTLVSVKEWYRQARGLNRNAVAFLVGTKFDLFTKLPPDQQEDIDKQVWSAPRRAPSVTCMPPRAHTRANALARCGMCRLASLPRP